MVLREKGARKRGQIFLWSRLVAFGRSQTSRNRLRCTDLAGGIDVVPGSNWLINQAG